MAMLNLLSGNCQTVARNGRKGLWLGIWAVNSSKGRLNRSTGKWSSDEKSSQKLLRCQAVCRTNLAETPIWRWQLSLMLNQQHCPTSPRSKWAWVCPTPIVPQCLYPHLQWFLQCLISLATTHATRLYQLITTASGFLLRTISISDQSFLSDIRTIVFLSSWTRWNTTRTIFLKGILLIFQWHRAVTRTRIGHKLGWDARSYVGSWRGWLFRIELRII